MNMKQLEQLLYDLYVGNCSNNDSDTGERLHRAIQYIKQRQRKSGLGGLHRASNLTASRRSQIASDAAKARWLRYALAKEANHDTTEG